MLLPGFVNFDLFHLHNVLVWLKPGSAHSLQGCRLLSAFSRLFWRLSFQPVQHRQSNFEWWCGHRWSWMLEGVDRHAGTCHVCGLRSQLMQGRVALDEGRFCCSRWWFELLSSHLLHMPCARVEWPLCQVLYLKDRHTNWLPASHSEARIGKPPVSYPRW